MKNAVSKIRSIVTFLLSNFIRIAFTHFRTQHVVVFESFDRRYNDSPKAVSEALHEITPDARIVWIVRNTKSPDIPLYATAIKYNSIKHFFYQSTGRVYVDNYVGKFTCIIDKKNTFLRKLKRNDQFNISIWHGTPIKQLALYNNNCDVFSTSDLFITGSNYNTRAVLGSFGLNVPTLNVGLPRNDILFDLSSSKKQEIRRRIGIPIEKKYVLFAPTFRDNAQLSSVNLLNELNVPLLLEALSKRFGGEWVLAFRVHPKMCDAIRSMKNILYDNINVFDGNIENDMVNYLTTCNALVSDYSGSLFDIALIDTPSFIYCEDIERYKNDRGLLFDIEKMPQSVARNLSELINNILKFDSRIYNEKRKLFLTSIGSYEKGNASFEVAKIIDEKLNMHK